MTLKELLIGINKDVEKGLETRRITMLVVRGCNNSIPYGADMIRALADNPDSGGYVFMCDPEVPENIIPVYKSALCGDIAPALEVFKRSVKNQITEKGRDKLEGFSVLHVENVSIRELQRYADSRVVRFYTARIPVPSTSNCFLYAEIEDIMLITGESATLYDGEIALYEEIFKEW